MFHKNMKLAQIIMIIFIMILNSVILYAECDFMAMLAKNGHQISNLEFVNEVEYFFDFQQGQSYQGLQNDGYGVIYYKDGDYDVPFVYENPLPETNQAFYLWGEYTHSYYQHHGPSSGYYWNDNNTPNVTGYPAGPEYVWIPRPGALTPIGFIHNDQGVSVNIGDDFEFYGNQYADMFINPNGWIGFDEDNTTYTNTPIPSQELEAPLLAIFGFWDDLNPEIGVSGGGNVYYEYQSAENRMVVWFEQVEKYGDPNTIFDFQIILYLDAEDENDDDIKIQYQSVQGITYDGTVGIQDLTGNIGLQVVYNENFTDEDSYVEDGLAVSFSTDEYPEPLDYARLQITTPTNNAVIVLGHDRYRGESATGATGQHPYRFKLNDKTYTFQHNGSQFAKQQMRDYLLAIDPDWFEVENHPLNWVFLGNDHTDVTTVGDTELLFHYIMSDVIEYNEDIVDAMIIALNESDLEGYNFRDSLINQTERVNIVLSDGEALYVFRNYSGYNLSYKDYGDFVGVKTRTTIPDGISLGIGSLVVIPRDGDIVVYDDILDGDICVSGTITGNVSWPDNHYIVGDLTIADEAVLTIEDGAELHFTGEYNLNINGELRLNEGAGLCISHSSAVNIDGSDAILFLDWGSTITGFTPTTYVEEEVIPGDRIIAQNGGKITTHDKDYYLTNPGPVITISSSSGELWDGIFIQNPGDEEDYWFVNCDISGISNLSIANVNDTQDVANLNLYLTDFTDAGQIVARHGHNLSISGEDSENRCNIRYNHKTPIVAYDSPVFIQYALIEENGRDENGGLLNTYCDGIYLNYASGDLSQILNSVIQNNTGCGISTYYDDVLIDNNTIQTNEQHGVLTKQGTFNDLQNTTILNNDCAEYVGCQSSYNWPEMYNTIQDLHNAGGNDQYILIAYEWDGIEQSIDVRRNTINHENNEHRFFPEYAAFRFDTGEIPPEREMLYSALDEMRLGNYLSAETGFQQVISQYPVSKEAAVAIRGLLFIESYTDQDYMALIDYIDAIQVSEESPLCKAKEDVKTKSFMKDKEYETAIERLEIVINTSQIPDDVIMAMIDQGYCYMELAEGGERSLPADCTVQTKTFKEYQAKVRELESQFSFFPEEENQNIATAAGSILSLKNFPNPFNPVTTISFDLASESKVSVSVYNLKGQKVKQLVNDQLSDGQHSVEWNGTDGNNKSVASGIYFYKISTGKDTDMRKMLLLK